MQFAYRGSSDLLSLALNCLLPVCALLLPTLAYAASSNLGLATGYLTSSYSVNEVASFSDERFSPFDFGKQLGFIDEPVWVSVKLDEIPSNDNVVLVISPVYMDEIDVYLARDPSQVLLSAGDTRYSPLSLDRYGYTLKLGPDFPVKGC